MAGKRKGKKRKKSAGIGSHFFVFAITLFGVLIAGMLVMVWYVAAGFGQGNTDLPEDNKADSRIIDFAGLGQQPSAPAGQNAQEDTSIEESVQEPEQTMTESEILYMEALGKGENAYLVECADSERVTFAFAGDVLLDDNYAMMSSYRSRGNDINAVFSADLLERMRKADVFMLNNEFPFSARGTPIEGKAFTFRANPSNIEVYEQLGVDVVSLANNHAYDYGEDALLDTFTTLENACIPYVGAGRNIDDAKKPVYFIANGIRIALVSATQIERNASPDTKEATATSAGVLRCMDPAALLAVIAEAKSNSDFVILYIHWGTESQEETDWLQDEQAPVYAEAGVDLIIGDHPHCLQKLDVVSGVPVVYSLGNFWFNSKTQDTCLVEIGINKDGMEYLRFVPCRQENCSTRQLDGSEKDDVLNYMRSLSPNVYIDEDGLVKFG